MLQNQNNFEEKLSLSLKSKYFKEKLIFSVTNLTNEKSPIKDIVNTSISSEINKIDVIDTYKGASNDGTYKSGLEIVASVKLKEKINYIGYDSYQTVHTIYEEHLNNISVVIPEKINGISTKHLISQNKLSIIPIVEGNMTRIVSPSSIYKYVLLFLDVNYRSLI